MAKPRPWFWYGAGATVAAGAAVTIAYRSRPPQTEWSAVVLWAVGLALWWMACRAPASERAARDADGAHRARSRRAELAAMAVLAAVAAGLILPALEVYPLEMAGDPVRDGGLFPRTIVDGDTKEIFRYGFYNGYSILIPFLGVPLYLAFPTSSLAFKALAALTGIVTPPLFFRFARRYLPFILALAAAVLMLALPVYLFYSRREPVVALNFPLMTAVLAALLPALEPNAPSRRLGLLAALAGFSTYFHAAVKAAGFLALALAAAVTFSRALARRHPWQRLTTGAGAAILGLVIGFGPLLQATDLDTFVARQRLGQPSGGWQLETVRERYETSLRVFFDQPTTSWFPKHQPLIPSRWLAALFAFGAVLGFLAVPLHVYWSMLFLVLLLPLTNSALLDLVNNDHRLTPLLPVIAFVMASGLGVIWRATDRLPSRIATRAARAAVLVLVGVAATPPVIRFFSEQQARRNDFNNHVLYFALREIDATPALRAAPALCVGGNAAMTEQMRLRHVAEGWRFYLPEKTVEVAELRPTAARNDLYIATSCTPRENDDAWSGKIFCAQPEPFICPSAASGWQQVGIYLEALPVTAGPPS